MLNLERNLQIESTWKNNTSTSNFDEMDQYITQLIFFLILYLLYKRASTELQNIIHISLWLENEFLLSSIKFLPSIKPQIQTQLIKTQQKMSFWKEVFSTL